MIHELSVFHVYTLTQSVTHKPERRTIEHRLVFGQSIRHNIRTRKLTSALNLTQTIGLRTSIYNLSVTHVYNPQQTIGRNPIELSVVSLLFHWQTIKRPFWEKVTSLFNPTQTIVGHGSKGVRSTLNLTQTVIGNVVRNRTITHNTGFVSGVAGWLSDPNFNYLNPVFTTLDKVTFTCGATSFQVRKPDFDDVYKYDLTRISRRSRGGDLLISRDNMWPSVKSFNLKFSVLTQAEVDQFLYFFKVSLGKRIQYLNYDNVLWEGFITNPQTAAQQTGRLDSTVTIEFEGEVV